MEELPLLAPTLDPIARQSVISQSTESLASQTTEMQTSPELPPRQYNKAVHNHSDNAGAVDKSVNYMHGAIDIIECERRLAVHRDVDGLRATLAVIIHPRIVPS